MAASQAAALLDELMGRDRDIVAGQRIPIAHWSDAEVCRNFLCGLCPYDLFTNTKADLGGCDKMHDVKLRHDYEKSQRYMRCGYEEELIKVLKDLIGECDKRVQRAYERIALDKSSREAFLKNQHDPRFKQLEELKEKAAIALREAEELGCSGEVLESQRKMQIYEQTLKEKDQVEQSVFGVSMGKELEVCEICAAFKIKDDLPCRQEEHLQGKMHVGYEMIRNFLMEFEIKIKHKRQKDEESREKSKRSSSSRHSRNSHKSSPRDEKKNKRSSRSRSPREKRSTNSNSHNSRHHHRHHKSHRNES